MISTTCGEAEAILVRKPGFRLLCGSWRRKMNKAQKYVLALFVGIMAVFVAVPAGAAIGSGLSHIAGTSTVLPSQSVVNYAWTSNGTPLAFADLNGTGEIVNAGNSSVYVLTNATMKEMNSNSVEKISVSISGSSSPAANNTTSKPAAKYNVTINDPNSSYGIALPKGTPWGVNISTGKSFMTNNSSITFQEPNGSYSYFVGAMSFLYSAVNSSGSFTVSGAPVNINVSFFVSQKLLVTAGTGNTSMLQVINPVNLSVTNISLPHMVDSTDATVFTPMSVVPSLNGSYAYVLCADPTYTSTYLNITTVNLHTGMVVHNLSIQTSYSTPQNANNMTMNPWSKVPQLILSIGNSNLTFVDLNNYTVKNVTLPDKGYSGSIAVSPTEPYAYTLSSEPAGSATTGPLNLSMIDLRNDSVAAEVSTTLPYLSGSAMPDGAMAISPFGNMIAAGASGVGTVDFYNGSLHLIFQVNSSLLDFNGAPPMMFSRNSTQLFYGNTTIQLPSVLHPAFSTWRYSKTPVTGMVEGFNQPFSSSMFNDTYLYYPDSAVATPTYYVKALDLLNNSTSAVEKLPVLPFAMSLVYNGFLTGMPGFGSWNFNISNFVANNTTTAVPISVEAGFGHSPSSFYSFGSGRVISSGTINFSVSPSYLTGNQSSFLMFHVNASYSEIYLTVTLYGSKNFAGPISGEDAGYLIGGVVVLAVTGVEASISAIPSSKGGRS